MSYAAAWFIVTWLASKYTSQSLREKLYRHPIATTASALLYLVDLPFRLSEAELGQGLTKSIDIFEYTVYYAVINYLWWLLICWVSEKLWRRHTMPWSWYRKVTDFLLYIIPPIYKLILGLIAALFIGLLLFVTLSTLFKYSGSDLKVLK